MVEHLLLWVTSLTLFNNMRIVKCFSALLYSVCAPIQPVHPIHPCECPQKHATIGDHLNPLLLFSSLLLHCSRLGIKKYAQRPCSGLSGGNKRKLALGVSLVGAPPVVLLDEPSTGQYALQVWQSHAGFH